MEYIQLTVITADKELQEILLALLAELGFESFYEKDDELLAYVQREGYNEQRLREFFNSDMFGAIAYKTDIISETNWNKLWEGNFEPVVIGEQCLIRAPFHEVTEKYPYELIIEPQMSFGTAHHETTAQMIEMMLGIDFEGCSVLDMGCGTGILAILASCLGAAKVVAIDNNKWAYNNAIHNIKLNAIDNIDVYEGDVSNIPNNNFDIILANINRNVLIEDIPVYIKHMKKASELVMSGFFGNNLKEIEKLTDRAGLKRQELLTRNSWVSVRLSR